MPPDSPEFGELVADLQEHGLLQPIVLHDGRIIDGEIAAMFCEHGEIEPRFVERSDDSPIAYVVKWPRERGSLLLHQRRGVDRARPGVVDRHVPHQVASSCPYQGESLAARRTAARPYHGIPKGTSAGI
jgi:hypothetical protein